MWVLKRVGREGPFFHLLPYTHIGSAVVTKMVFCKGEGRF